MFTYDGTTVDNGATVGLYTVRFFNNAGCPEYVTVDTELPSAGEYYDHVDNALGTQALWVALAEKAYAEANGLGYVTTNNEYQDSYNALNYGDPAWACMPSPGNPRATTTSTPPTSPPPGTRATSSCCAPVADQFLHCRQPLLRRRRLQRGEQPTVRGVQPVGHRLFGVGPRPHRHDLWPVLGERSVYLAELHHTVPQHRGDQWE